jgi:hypothetical protein
MYNQKNITKYYTDDFDRKMLDRSYCVLISPKFSIERKLTAVEFLSRFAKIQEHRERLEILRDRESNFRVKKHLQKALDGTLFDYLTQAFKDFELIDSELEECYSEDKRKIIKESARAISNNLPFLRYQSRLSTND